MYVEMTLEAFDALWEAAQPVDLPPFPVCQDCYDAVGGACGGPDAPYRLAEDGETCKAEDCAGPRP